MRVVLEKLMAWFLGWSRPLVVVLLDTLKRSTGDLIHVALQVAIPIVSDLEKGEMPSGEKRDAAKRKIEKELRSLGYTVAARTINAALELAVLRLKAGDK